MQLIDLSHTIEPDIPRFSAKVPSPRLSAWMSHAQAAASGNYEGCTCEISEVQFVTSLGTYMDSPYHFNPDGCTIDRLSLDQLVLPGVLIDCTWAAPRQPIGPTVLDGIDVTGKAVLFNTGWSRFWGDPAYDRWPFLTRETAQTLGERGAKLVGIDTLVIDTMDDPRRPVHVTLLHQNILIVENLTNLGALSSGGFVFHAAPVKFAGAAAFPVRAYAVIS